MSLYLQPHFRNRNGTIAQLVEQWTENPCVPGSNPGSTTLIKPDTYVSGFLFLEIKECVFK